MRIPQTPDRVKEAPAQALRAMFAGVGQALLLPGRVLRRGGHEHATAVSSGEVSGSTLSPQTDTAQTDTAPAGTATATATLEADQATVPAPRPAEASAAAPADTPEASVAAKTSTAKASSTKAAPAKAAPAKASTAKAKAPAAKGSASKAAAAEASAVQASAAVAPAAAKAEATTVKEEISKPAAATAELPIPNYPDLTIASLRARMRGLDISQLGTLLDYERSHDSRENVITMFERRIVKLQDEGSAAS